jgi:hypothetical protein
MPHPPHLTFESRCEGPRLCRQPAVSPYAVVVTTYRRSGAIRAIPSLAACLALSLAGCGIADFDVEQPVPAQTIQGSGIPAPLAAIFPLPLSLELDSKIKAKETGPIDSVTLSSLTLQITSSEGDWSFVRSIEVTVESTKAGTALPKVKIASAASPGAVKTLEFAVESSVNLKPYIDEGSQVNSSSMGTQPTRDVSFDGKGVFTVHPF